MIKEIKNNELENNLRNDLVLVDFYATWCGPCKMMHPIIDKVVEEFKDLEVLKVNVDENEELAREYGIMSIPTLILFKDKKIVEKKTGFTSNEEINNWIMNHK